MVKYVFYMIFNKFFRYVIGKVKGFLVVLFDIYLKIFF